MCKDIIIVLSGGIDPENGGMPNSWVKLRYEKAMELYLESGRSSIIIILTAGKTYRLNESACTEAQAGKNYLLSRYQGQINPNDIILEEDSKDTLSNAYSVAKILIRERIKSFHVVTSEFHMEKSRYIFEKIVFPEEDGWKILFHKSLNGNVDEQVLQARMNSEKQVLDFYRQHLEKTFSVVPGDMKTIENFILNVSKAYNPNSDEPHQAKLTQDIQKVNQELKNPLY